MTTAFYLQRRETISVSTLSDRSPSIKGQSCSLLQVNLWANIHLPINLLVSSCHVVVISGQRAVKKMFRNALPLPQAYFSDCTVQAALNELTVSIDSVHILSI